MSFVVKTGRIPKWGYQIRKLFGFDPSKSEKLRFQSKIFTFAKMVRHIDTLLVVF